MIKISTILILMLCLLPLHSIPCNVTIIVLNIFFLFHYTFLSFSCSIDRSVCGALRPNSGGFGFENLFYILFALNGNSCMQCMIIIIRCTSYATQNSLEMPTPKLHANYIYGGVYIQYQCTVWQNKHFITRLSFAQYFRFYRL